jgi:acyl carrier protein
LDSRDELTNYLLKEVLGTGAVGIDENSSLIRDGLLNSIGLMRLIRFLSEHFHIEFHNQDYRLENFETIARVREFVNHKRNNSEPSGTSNA